ncbi:MAG: helix-turn-helix transcriptional regulator [Candidatus Dactylopiibacterium sp.]|nr:helix-turn-helix transcriptional regulator [Candidatus Dactylopiibacterium sp.]
METRRKELGEFLQVLRRRSAPADFGFATGARRRTEGLRREEVAQLVGISPTWYTWIEQGRAINISSEALDRLASQLRLTRSERAYLFEMADRRDPHAPFQDDDAAPAPLLSLLDEIRAPAYLMGRHWDVLGWNGAAATLFAGWLDTPRGPGEAAHNMLRFVFLRPETRGFLADWETRARRIAAEFRADCRTRLDEPALQRLVAELEQASPEFARFWKQHDVLERQGGERAFQHPAQGLIRYQQTTLRPVENEQIKLVVLQALG